MDVLLDSFMLRYDNARSASLIYYISLLEVVFAWGLLGLTAIFTTQSNVFAQVSAANCTLVAVAQQEMREGLTPIGGGTLANI